MSEVKMKKCKAEGCSNMFTPSYSTLQKYCSSQCTYNEKRKQPQRAYKPINKKSDKRTKEEKIYAARRIVFLAKKENQKCPVYPNQKTTEVHHKKGRVGSLYLDERFWLAVSHEGHKYIELNPIESKEKGWSMSRLSN